jgi:hypothetical protein
MNELEKSFRRGSWQWLERRIAKEIRAAERLRRPSSRRKPFIEVLELVGEHSEALRRRTKAARN